MELVMPENVLHCEWCKEVINEPLTIGGEQVLACDKDCAKGVAVKKQIDELYDRYYAWY